MPPTAVGRVENQNELRRPQWVRFGFELDSLDKKFSAPSAENRILNAPTHHYLRPKSESLVYQHAKHPFQNAGRFRTKIEQQSRKTVF